MTTDQRFTLLILGLGLMFTVLSAILGLLVRVTIRWTRTEDRLTEVIGHIASHGDRLTYLEREQLRRYRRGG